MHFLTPFTFTTISSIDFKGDWSVSGMFDKVSKGAKRRNRYNQVPHLTQDTNGKATNSQLDTTNKSQDVSIFPTGDHKAHINRRAKCHSKHKTEKNIKYAQKKYRLGMVSKIFYWKAQTSFTTLIQYTA